MASVEGAGERIGERLRRRRLELGLSQRDLSQRGVSYAYISRIEAGVRQPSVKALRKLAPRLEVSVAWLETGEEDSAVALAQLVLEHEDTLPDFGIILARRVLLEHGSGAA